MIRPKASSRTGRAHSNRRAAGRVARRWNLVLVAVVAGACRESASPGPALPPAPPVVLVTMEEYGFRYDPHIPAGRVVFRFVNGGRLEHRPALLPLGEQLPPIAEQVRGTRRAAVTPFAGIPLRWPRQTGTFAVDLARGQRYAVLCFVREPDGTSHALKGMASEFRAGEQGDASP